MHHSLIYTFIRSIHTLHITLHVVVIGWIAVFFKMALNTMSIRNVVGNVCNGRVM
jgi:hypothetical protein